MNLLQKTLEGIKPLDNERMIEARNRVNNLTKPVGSLGKLEDIAVRLSGITGNLYPEVDKKMVIVMAADNGVCDANVAAYPQEVSAIIARCMVLGIAGISVFSKLAGAQLKVIDLGIKEELCCEGIENKKIMKGTNNMTRGPAMTREQAIQAVETGIKSVFEAVESGINIIAAGEVGIGNTTTSSAVLAVLEDLTPEEVTGRGAGLDDEGLRHKVEMIRLAIDVNKPDKKDVIDVISKVGGLDIAGMAGIFLGAAYKRVPVIIDGFISSVAALAAVRMASLATDFMFPSHISAEAACGIVLDRLGMEPYLHMNMRLGEGSGAALAFQLIEAAGAMIREMKTFEEMGIQKQEYN